MTKTYTVVVTRKGRDREVAGTVEELKNYFSYTLEVGNSMERKINRNPTTIRSLLLNVQKSYGEKEAACMERTSISLKH